jgi:glycosyltransferase involved in cell wall biosynthesis
LAHAGPAHARNVGASIASNPVVLFLGDDILPANDQFFRVHAQAHADQPEDDFAVLGKVEWPAYAEFRVTYAMRHAQETGPQFAYSRLTPGAYASWQFFYTSNVSVKKGLVANWMADGFDSGFEGAVMEDVEFAYRIWRSKRGLRTCYAPESLGMHYHAYTLRAFLQRQRFAGRCLRRVLELHPELITEYSLEPIDRALRSSKSTFSQRRFKETAAMLMQIEAGACLLEASNRLGNEQWHNLYLSALWELFLQEGYVDSWAAEGMNLTAARELILRRFFSRWKGLQGRFLPLSILVSGANSV